MFKSVEALTIQLRWLLWCHSCQKSRQMSIDHGAIEICLTSSDLLILHSVLCAQRCVLCVLTRNTHLRKVEYWRKWCYALLMSVAHVPGYYSCAPLLINRQILCDIFLTHGNGIAVVLWFGLEVDWQVRSKHGGWDAMDITDMASHQRKLFLFQAPVEEGKLLMMIL